MIVKKVKSDKEFAAKFANNPFKAIESILGPDLPDDKVNALIDGVKAKLKINKTDGLPGSVKNLFKK